MKSKQPKKLTKMDLFQVFHRSFYVQAVWNFERLQNLGFLFSVVPIIKRLYPSGKEKNEAIKRHLEFFNTHPFMANVVLGVVASMEEKNANNHGSANPDDIHAMKSIMSGPLAAIGDAFFWATLRPFSAIFAILLVFNLAGEWKILGPLFFILFFNVFGLYFRINGLQRGYRMGTGVVDILKKFDLQELITIVSILGLLVLAVLMVTYISNFLLWENVIFMSTFLISFAMLRKKVNLFYLIYAVIGWGIILRLFGVNF